MNWLQIIAVGLIGVILIPKWKKWRRVVGILDKLPGPESWPIFGNTFQFIINREEIVKVATKLFSEHEQFFSVWTLFFSACFVAKAEYVETLLSSTEEIKKGYTYSFLEPWLGTGLLTSTGQKWASHRKLFTSSFHFSILETFIDTFKEKSDVLVDRLKTLKQGTEFNMYPYITLCTLDIICEAVMGVDINIQEDIHRTGKMSDYVSGVYTISETSTDRLFKPWLFPDIFFYNISSEGRAYSKALKHVHQFSNKIVREKVAKRADNKEVIIRHEEDNIIGTRRKRAFLDLLLEASQGSNLTHDEIREQVDTFMFEGHDTTSAAICWSLFLLGNYLEIQEKVYEELNSICRPRDITSTQLKEMKYLERVIKETLRLYPSVGFFSRTLKNDLLLGEHTIPAGVDLWVSAYHLHRSPEHFQNPLAFDPDHFLPEKVKQRHPFAYVPFSAGSRNCIGQKFAMMELKTVLATILLNFRIEATERPEDVTVMTDVILKPKSGLKVKLFPRK